MADYEYITHIDARNFTPAKDCPAVFGYPRKNTSITVHWWGEPGKTGNFDQTTDYLASANTRRVSSNYVAEAGRVACIVDPDNASWANGHPRGNAQSITIECNPRASKADHETVAELIANLRSVYGDIPIHGHNYWTSTACPGTYDLALLDRLADGVKVGTAADTVEPIKPKPRPVQKPAPKKGLYWTVEPGDTLGKVADYYAVSVAALTKHNHLKNPNVITVGQHIRIPGPLYWTIQRGDSLEAIANYYGISYAVLERNAGLVGKRPIIGTSIRVA